LSRREQIVSGINGKWKLSKKRVTGMICIAGFFLSLAFTAGSGLYWLDIVDHFIANFGLVLIGLVECIVLGWIFGTKRFRNHANKTSEIKIGKWWDILIIYVIPSVLTILLLISIINLIQKSYDGHPWWILIICGAIPCITIFILSFVFMKIKKSHEVEA
jgi:NSS family neurotransmitter:Na+ symporter